MTIQKSKEGEVVWIRRGRGDPMGAFLRHRARLDRLAFFYQEFTDRKGNPCLTMGTGDNCLRFCP